MHKNGFTEQFDSHIKLIYSFFDRLIIRGYIHGMFDPKNVIILLRNLGFSKHTNGVIKLLAEQLGSHIRKEAENKGVPILWRDNIGGKDLNMQRYVEQNYVREGLFGTICIIKSMENVGTYWNKDIITKEGKPFTKMYWCNKPVSQYYIYINDKDLGLCCLKISSYLPFYCQFYCNGHQYLKQQFDKRRIGYKMEDNSFIDIEDQDTLKKLVNDFKGSIIELAIKRWMDIWFSFNKGERSRCSALLNHRWYTCQSEICSNIIFKNKGYFDKVYDKLLEKHHRIGMPDSLSKVFDLKRERQHSNSTQKIYYKRACIKHWIQGNSIKMYNKGGYLLRVETTINNPGLPGAKLHKPVYDIKGYYWYGHGCNNRFLEALSEVDSSQLNDTSTKYTETLITEKGKRIAAPDLRQKKQLALVAALLNCRYSSEWFRVKDLMPCLSGDYSKTAEIRYQLQKLKERGLLEKRQGANYYRVTREGYIWLYVSYCQIRYFVNPLLSTSIEKGIRQKMDSLDEFEKAVRNIHDGLSSIYQQLNIAA
ncbi:MAG: hypothetical protein WA816_12950 [Bacteroidales bacterium]